MVKFCRFCGKEKGGNAHLIIDPASMRIYWLCEECYKSWLLEARSGISPAGEEAE
ncbi:MAG: hypothetical protein QXU81_08690 [Candidatus Bathyarchaeia archaeon]